MVQDATPSTATRKGKVLALVSFTIGVGCAMLSSNALFSSSGEQHLVVQQPEITLAQLTTPARSSQFRVPPQVQQAMLQPIAKIAMLALQDTNPGSKARDVSLKAQIKEEVSHLDAATKSKLLKVRAEVATKAEEEEDRQDRQHVDDGSEGHELVRQASL